MAEARSDQEPSIEEILASIREIISDDDAAEQKAAETSKPASAPEPAPVLPDIEPDIDDDILDLSAFAEEPKTPRNIEERPDPLAGIDLSKSDEINLAFTDPEEITPPAPPPAPEPVFTPEPEPIPEPTPAPVAVTMAPPPVVHSIIDTDSLLDQTVKAASVDSLARLAQNIAISRGAGGTLEDIVREMIRPMLKDWLDRNLPPMIERMVERELERLVKTAMDR